MRHPRRRQGVQFDIDENPAIRRLAYEGKMMYATTETRLMDDNDLRLIRKAMKTGYIFSAIFMIPPIFLFIQLLANNDDLVLYSPSVVALLPSALGLYQVHNLKKDIAYGAVLVTRGSVTTVSKYGMYRSPFVLSIGGYEVTSSSLERRTNGRSLFEEPWATVEHLRYSKRVLRLI